MGTVVSARIFAQARNPSYKLEIDFGEFGIRKSSAQITKRYNVDELVGRQVVAVLNFPPKQIGPFMSECLVLGAADGAGDVVLISPQARVPDGWRIS